MADDPTRRAPRSIHEYRDVVLSADGPRSSAARLVAVTLAQVMDGKTFESFAGAEAIAVRSGLSVRAVRMHLPALARDGWLLERTKEKGRNFWLKIRTATIPLSLALPAYGAGSLNGNGHALPATPAGSRLPANGDRLPANGAGHPADSDATPCKSPHGDPAGGAWDLGRKSGTDPEQDPGRSGPAVPTGQPSRSDRGSLRLSAIELERQVNEEKARERREDGLKTSVLQLLREGKSEAEIVSQLGGKVELDQVRGWKAVRDRMPFIRGRAP